MIRKRLLHLPLRYNGAANSSARRNKELRSEREANAAVAKHRMAHMVLEMRIIVDVQAARPMMQTRGSNVKIDLS